MSIDTLRALSREYAAGNIDRETYRRTRRDMLRKIVAGELPVVPFHAPEPEAPTVFPYEENDGDTTQEIIPGSAALAAARAARRRKWLPLIGGIVVVVVLAGVGLATYTRVTTPKAAPVAQAPAATAGSDLLDDFLSANTWTAGSLSELTTQWDGLPASGRDELVQSDSAHRLAAAVVGQIRAEDALFELGEAEDALETQGQLLDLVEHLGITSDRLSQARTTWNDRRAATAQTVTTTTAESGAAAPAPATPAAAEPAEASPAPATETPDATVPGVETATTTPTPPAAEAAPRPAPTPAAEIAPAASAEPAASVPPAPPAAKPVTASTASKPAPPAANAGSSKKAATGPRTNCKATLIKTRRPYCIDVAANGTKGPLLVVLPSGNFDMGGREATEQPRHKVTLALPFAIGMFEISAGEFAQFCKASGATCPAQPWDNPALPVVNVSWAQARAYAEWLSRLTGASYRLPTESEWEYVARGGSTTEYPFGDELLPTHARYSYKNEQDEPLAANDRSLNRNGFRVYHIVGNVREWVADSWVVNYANAPLDGSARESGSATERVVRGGSYADAAEALRSTARMPLVADEGDRYTGFRLVRLVK